ncbi:hypothetical protein CUT44_31515 [Streptomyces carminius]|uniref:UL36 very large tegument protein n=1 Tax=Streptomyces carminius TaxID=2665496 RepID=A0A2M8LPM8_9ACTN|nr:hypothetical protein CUT44_31515 [Streptomyces carminius]
MGELAGALDPEAGWYGVFGRRDPDGLAACLAGHRTPPWDVVASLLDDFATYHGPRRAGPRAARLRALHRAAVLARDRAAGDPGELRERLAALRHERWRAVRREQALARAQAAGGHPAGTGRPAADLAWARDDRARATARCQELSDRLAALEAAPEPAREPGSGREPVHPAPEPVTPEPGAPAAEPPSVPLVPSVPSAPSEPVRPRLRGARFAGLEAASPEESPEEPAAVLPPVAPPAPARPRGARFAGARDDADAHREERAETAAREARIRRECDEIVARLAGLRALGRTGEEHIALCEAAHRPAGLLPVLAGRLEDTGRAADVATVLWEVAALPPARLAAAADALTAAGRQEECLRTLRQSAARPAGEVAATALALAAAGRRTEALELLSALVRARRPEEAAEVVSGDPAVLTPLLLAAAARVSDRRRRDVEGLLARGYPAGS